MSKPSFSIGWWFGLLTDSLCIMTAAVLVGAATGSVHAAGVATVVTAGLLYWWRDRNDA